MITYFSVLTKALKRRKGQTFVAAKGLTLPILSELSKMNVFEFDIELAFKIKQA